ncbi:MAG: sulfite exporter TauE/SafE family protein [Candidatus Omnitrophota bacterium]|nr:sulfite exporter TauE/SafE family protein [Candidatus Omnitrophota bacterium]
MLNVVTILELFGIGFSFGLAGPCLLVCTPVLIAYIAGKQVRLRQALVDIAIFLTGRLLAYLVLGYLAGLSGFILRQFSNSSLVVLLKACGGMIIILLGIYVWIGKEPFSWACKHRAGTIFNFTSLFILGFVIGIFPCAPLLALLFEIALVSKSAWGGLLYALFFGLGTFISGFIVVGALSGIFTRLPPGIFKSRTGNLIFRTICASLLILLGLRLILRMAN